MSLVKKIAIGLAALFALLALTSLVVVWWVGAWHLVFPTTAHDEAPPAVADNFGEGRELRILSFSKTNAFRHKEGIAGARSLFDELAERRDWAFFHTENGAIFDAEGLARFDVVIFSNATGDMLSEAQEAAFKIWLEDGGGWIGIHSAGDGSHEDWPWYRETLIATPYLGHILGPQKQEARVVVENPDHPVTRGLPSEFRHEEEWYSWGRSARTLGFDVLLTVDEASYEPYIRGFGQEMDIRMQDHPIVWSRCIGEGRALYSAMGHWAEAYATAPYSRLLENGIEWAGGLTEARCGDREGE